MSHEWTILPPLKIKNLTINFLFFVNLENPEFKIKIDLYFAQGKTVGEDFIFTFFLKHNTFKLQI